MKYTKEEKKELIKLSQPTEITEMQINNFNTYLVECMKEEMSNFEEIIKDPDTVIKINLKDISKFDTQNKNLLLFIFESKKTDIN